eukprot:357218-Chlamydomonas_euryale.AAC.39
MPGVHGVGGRARVSFRSDGRWRRPPGRPQRGAATPSSFAHGVRTLHALLALQAGKPLAWRVLHPRSFTYDDTLFCMPGTSDSSLARSVKVRHIDRVKS